MSKGNLFVRILIFTLLLAVVMPAFIGRIDTERKNKDVVFALNVNSIAMHLSNEEIAQTLKRNREIGVRTAVVAEENINSLINGGYVTAIKYNVLCHKYDDESEEIIKALGDNDKIHNDSYVLITKRDEWKSHLNKWITSKYTDAEYTKIETAANADVYVIYRDITEGWHIPAGFDENKLAIAGDNGYEIMLSLMLGAYENTEYIELINEIVDEYNVKYINLKKAYSDQSANKNAQKNYDAFCKMIKEKNLYLVLTEEQTQLSNQKPIGYQNLIDSANGRVLRSYETVDFETTNTGATIYEKRYNQIINSVMDRNIRFVVINQLTNGTDSANEKSNKTNLSTDMAFEKLKSIGFNTEEYNTVYKDYTVNRRLVSAAAMLVMILMCLTMIEWLLKKNLRKLEILSAIGAALSVPFTYIVPDNLLLLYPTLFAIISPCFAVTALMVYAKAMQKKQSNIAYIISGALLSVGIMLLCAIVQSALLSGLDYYLNSLIFKGIKISLIAPVIYSMIAYGMIFAESSEGFILKIRKLLCSNIKVYWAIFAVVFGGAAIIYLIRSGNVETISGFESTMRKTITQFMPARPRTKEFLVGWPCLMLMLYYIKNTQCTPLRWGLSVGASILFASIINSFCHVFTSAGTIFMRVFNGALIGIVVSVIVLLINNFVIRMIKTKFKTGK